jgi:hypothetical protein
MKTLLRYSLLLSVAVLCGALYFASQPVTASAPAATGTNLWSLTMIEEPDDWEAVRINTATGQAWAAQGGKWVALNEPGEWPPQGEPGTYQCHATYATGSKSWYTLRFNVRTGDCWSLSGPNWKPIAN